MHWIDYRRKHALPADSHPEMAQAKKPNGSKDQGLPAIIAGRLRRAILEVPGVSRGFLARAEKADADFRHFWYLLNR